MSFASLTPFEPALKMAERTRFELARRLRAHTLSKRAPSTTRPPFRINKILTHYLFILKIELRDFQCVEYVGKS